MRSILSPTPLNLVDLLFYFEGLQVIELGFVGLEFGMEFVLARFFLIMSDWICKLEEDNRLIVHAAANAQRAVDCILGESFEDKAETVSTDAAELAEVAA